MNVIQLGSFLCTFSILTLAVRFLSLILQPFMFGSICRWLAALSFGANDISFGFNISNKNNIENLLTMNYLVYFPLSHSSAISLLLYSVLCVCVLFSNIYCCGISSTSRPFRILKRRKENWEKPNPECSKYRVRAWSISVCWWWRECVFVCVLYLLCWDPENVCIHLCLFNLRHSCDSTHSASLGFCKNDDVTHKNPIFDFGLIEIRFFVSNADTTVAMVFSFG